MSICSSTKRCGVGGFLPTMQARLVESQNFISHLKCLSIPLISVPLISWDRHSNNYVAYNNGTIPKGSYLWECGQWFHTLWLQLHLPEKTDPPGMSDLKKKIRMLKQNASYNFRSGGQGRDSVYNFSHCVSPLHPLSHLRELNSTMEILLELYCNWEHNSVQNKRLTFFKNTAGIHSVYTKKIPVAR